MENNIPADYISKISKASAYFIFRNGPIKELHKNGIVTDEQVKDMQ